MATFHPQYAVKIVLFVLAGVCIAQNNNDSISDNGAEVNGDEKSPTEKGMEPLYIMTQTFLDIVHPPDRDHFTTALGVSLEEIEESPEVLAANWKVYTKHYLGFAICIAIGLLYIIIMPIVGCCFCICRCIRNCGAKSHKNPEKGSQRYKRVCCGIFLLLFNTLMLAGMVCAFVTNELLRGQTSRSDDGVLSKAQQNIRRVREFQHSVERELEIEGVTNFEIKLDKLIEELEDAPEKARQNISKLTNADNVISSAESLVASVLSINQSLTQVQELTDSLQVDMGDLSYNLNVTKAAALTSLDKPECSVPSCTDAKSQVNQLAVNPDYSQVKKVDDQLRRIKSTLDHNLEGLVEKGKYEFQDISDIVLNDTQKQIEEVKQKKNEVITDVRANLVKLIKEVDKMIPLNDSISEIEDIKPQVENYANYRYYAGIGLASILLLIILLYYLGLCFGACGEAPGEDNSCCNRGIGATVLMVGVAFTFLFCWLLMLVVLLIFLAGGITYAEVCRPLDKLDNTTISLLQPFVKNKVNFSVPTAISECRENKGIYYTFELDKHINLDEVLDLQKYGVREKLDELVNNINVAGLASVEVISPDTKRRLNELKDSGLDTIDFQSYRDQLAKALVSPDLDPIINKLNALADSVPEPYKAEIAGHASTLSGLRNGLIAEMKRDIANLEAALTTLENEFTRAKGNGNFSVKVDNLIKNLETLQSEIRTNGHAMVKSFVRNYGDKIYDDMDYYITDRKLYIERDLGKCRPLFNLLVDTINIGCNDFLNPFNGFWFSIGWCIFFFIPSIIFAVALVSLYRRTDDYDDADYRSFDEANYDAYTGSYPGDNIPLEDMNRRKKAQHNGSGMQNQGYERDGMSGRSGGYPDGRDQRYREDYRNGQPDDMYRGGYGGGYPQGYDAGGGYDHRGGYPYAQTTSNPPHYYNNRNHHY